MPAARARARAGRTGFSVSIAIAAACCATSDLDRADLRLRVVRPGDGEVIPERCRRRPAAGLERIDEPTRAVPSDQANRALRLPSAARAGGEHARCDDGEDEHQCDCSAHFDSSFRRLIRQATLTWGWSVAIVKRPL